MLLAIYLALSLGNHPGGYLGTDTGGKVASLRAMERNGGLDPDVGYWAEQWDPAGRLHPLYYTSRLGEKWVNATTLPMLYAAYPLWRVGGYRAALLLPMLGSLLAAFAARAIARRVSGGRWRDRVGWAAFWLTGLASPVAVYALDFWEHSLGVAAVGWGAVFVWDAAVAPGRPAGRAVVAGLLFGLGLTLRGEALIYAMVATAVAAAALYRRRRRVAAADLAGGVAVGLLVPLALNLALERATAGGAIRTSRALSTGAGAGRGPNRVGEAVLTAVGLEPSHEATSYVVGLALAGLLVFAALRAGWDGGARGPTAVALGGAGILYAIRFTAGTGFVPGLLAAAPLGAIGLAVPAGAGWMSRRLHPVHGPAVVLAAAACLPLVWATQFLGGARPQWGGRYLLPVGLVLGAVGVAILPALARWAAAAFVAFALAVTAFGLAWLSVRSHDVARASAALARRPEPVLVSLEPHLAREAGARFGVEGDRRWLTAETEAEAVFAASVVDRAGEGRFTLVAVGDHRPPAALGPFLRGGRSRIRLFAGRYLYLTTYRVP